MTFGRPSAIPEDYVKLDLPRPLPRADGSSLSLAEVGVAFFNATMQVLPGPWP